MSDGIDVKDKLPEDVYKGSRSSEVVLVYLDYGDETGDCYLGYINHLKIWMDFSADLDKILEYTPSIKVTHWKPLPTPPKV